MKNLRRWTPGIMALFLIVMATTVTTQFAMADGVETTVLPDSWANEGGINEILKFVLNFVVYGLGAAAVLGTVIAGVMYMTARDNESQVAEAKKRLFNVVIGLAAWALMWTAMNWLIPGGILLGTSSDQNGGGSSNGGQSSSQTEPVQSNGGGTQNSGGGNRDDGDPTGPDKAEAPNGCEGAAYGAECPD